MNEELVTRSYNWYRERFGDSFNGHGNGQGNGTTAESWYPELDYEEENSAE